MSSSKKLYVIVNKELPSGVAMNAVAHVAFGLSAKIGVAESFLQSNIDQSGNNWQVSGLPFIVLRGKLNAISANSRS